MRALINWLYRKWGSKDVVAMTREQLFGVNLYSKEFDFGTLPQNERNYLSLEAAAILDNPTFQMALSLCKERFFRHARDVAQDDLIMFCDRFSINGVSAVEEQLKFMSGLTDEKTVQASEPHNLFDNEN